MDPNRVASLVDGLTSTFEAGLAFYTKWKQKQERENNYQRSPLKKSPADTKCSLVTSLDISSHRIEATYQVGFALIGPEFAVGDTICRDCLWTNLSRLGDSVEFLRRNILARRPGPLNLYDIIHVSEATRHSCIAALAEQYSRQASGRAIPQHLPVPNLRPSNRPSEPCEASTRKPRTAQEHDSIEFDRRTAVWSTSSGPPGFQSEPPSPPLTPRLRPDDSVSTAGTSPPRTHADPLGPDNSVSVFAGASSHSHSHPSHHLNISSQSGTATRTSRRPNNSVFSIFCPEAMALQVDPSRAVPPSRQQPQCRCGYTWDANPLGEEAGVLLKEGFRMTRRFLAKSHCDQLGDGGGHGYGCVLCTSSGRTETYGTAEMLRTHVVAAHTKWQMLHDRDMA
ncbi:hypothetical protein GE09DRAFT_1183933 [Coniochaeta sp. 2T2.1]|nr:hypothetical protein GE09DRAFT_1183933 [Coniochaeta sp. 2T2.1]